MNRTTFVVLAAAILATAVPVPAQYLYTQQVGLVTGPTVMTEGCLLVDVDGDTDLDVVFANGYVLNTSGPAAPILPTLLINKINLSLGLVDETAARLPATALKATLAVAFDIDGDGDRDLVFSCNGGTQQRCYVNDGAGNFADQSTTRLAGAVLTAAGLAYGDVDQDGDLDLLFNDELTNGQLKLFLNNGSGVFTNVTATHIVASPKTNQQDIVLADFDNDWDLDILNCGKSSGQQIYLNDGTGHFPTVNTSLLPAGTGLTYETEAADLDHDADLDLTMLSVSGFTDTVIRNNLAPSGTLSFTSLTSAFTGANGDDDNEWVFVDSDNDGDLDIVIGSLGATEKLYVNNGTFSFARATSFAGFSPVADSTLDAAVGDLNGDGVYDFVTAQGESGSFLNRAYYGTGPADTQPPRFVRVEQLPAVSTNPAGPWNVRAVIQDSFVDDGETPVATATMDWTVTHRAGVLTGSTPMKFLGGLMFRAVFTPPPGIVMGGATVAFTLTATDVRGNSATTPQQSFWICGAEAYGLGLGGTNTAVMLPQSPTGLSPGTTFTMTLTNAGPDSPGIFGIALGRWNSIIPEGIVLIDPNSFVGTLPVLADSSGNAVWPLPLPALPLVGLPVTFQSAFTTPVSMSNAIELVICP